MDTDKKAFITFLIIAGLFSGYWIFGGVFSYVSDYFSENNSTYSFETSGNTKSSFIEDPNQEIENITNKIALNISDKFMADGIVNEKDLEGSATENLLEKIDLNNINDISEISDNIYPEDFGIIYKIDNSKLDIVSDSPKVYEKYWTDYTFLISEIMPKIENIDSINNLFDGIIGSSNTSGVEALILDINSTYNAFLNMKVPQSLIGFHSDNIIFFKNLSSVLYSMLKYNEDPLRAYVLIEYFPELIKDWNSITESIDKYLYK